MQIKNGSRKMIFDNVNKKNLASSSDAEDISNETDSGDVVRFLVENYSEDEIKYAVAGEDSTIRVTDSDSVADIYVGSGKTSALNFDGYDEEIFINLSDKNYQNIGMARGGNDTSILFGSSSKETLIAGNGESSIWSAGGGDLLIGNTSEDKNSATTFFFMQGDGYDTIQNFEFLTADNSDTADKIDTHTSEVRGIFSDGENVSIYVGDDRLILQNADGKDFQINGITAQIAENKLTYDGRANYYQATGKNATLTVDSEVTNANIWLENSEFVGKIKVLDASNFEDSATLAGGESSEKIIAGSGNSSLWGGSSGNDTLIGGSGDDEFFYSFGNGKDIINNATENDVVNIFHTKPNQITKVEATISQIKFSFSDFGSLTINSSENVGINYQGTIYQLDRQSTTWSKK